MNDKIKVILLLSGGIDSTALLDFYLKQNADVTCIHFQYDQPNSKSELKAVESITSYYQTDKKIIDIKMPMTYRKDELIGRNAFFILSACSLGYNPVKIAIGIHAGSRYYDCSNLFLGDIQRIMDGYFSGTVQVEAPFINFSKTDIFEYCKKYNIPVEITYSCYRKNYPPCGKCFACLDRERYYEN